MQQRKFLLKGLLIALVGIIADQLSKAYILYDLQLARAYENGLPVLQNFNHSIEVTSFFNIVLVWNYGVSFGMFNDGVANSTQTILLCAFTLAVVSVILYLLIKTKSKYEVYAYSLVIGGAIGNLIDRVLYGAVVDFLDFHAFGYHWPSFNVADSIILIGVLLLVFEGFFVKVDNHEKK